MDIVAAIDQAIGCEQCGRPLDDSPSDLWCSEGCQQAWQSARTTPLTGYREPWGGYYPEDYETGRVPRSAAENRVGVSVSAWFSAYHAGIVGVADAFTAMGYSESEAQRLSQRFSERRDASLAPRVLVHDAGTLFTGSVDGWREIGAVAGSVLVDVAASTPGTDVDQRRGLDALREHGADLDVEDVEFLSHHGHEIRTRLSDTIRGVEFTAAFVDEAFVDSLFRASEGMAELAAVVREVDDRQARALEARRNRNTGPRRTPRPPRSINANKAR